MPKPLPSYETLHKLLRYEADTGKLFWKFRESASPQLNGRLSGKEAFTCVCVGYKKGRIYGVSYQAHRIIWKMINGYDPNVIDHINGERANNRIENLRDVSQRENCKGYSKLYSGNTSGFCGVSYVKRVSRWRAYISNPKGQTHLGYFVCIGKAITIRKNANKEFGFSTNHGSPV